MHSAHLVPRRGQHSAAMAQSVEGLTLQESSAVIVEHLQDPSKVARQLHAAFKLTAGELEEVMPHSGMCAQEATRPAVRHITYLHDIDITPSLGFYDGAWLSGLTMFCDSHYRSCALFWVRHCSSIESETDISPSRHISWHRLWKLMEEEGRQTRS